MKIQWVAHSCFHVVLEEGTSLVFDPFSDIGYTLPELRADMVFLSHQHHDHNAADKVSGDFVLFDKPGLYREGGVTIEGIPSFHDKELGRLRGENVVFKVCAEGLTLAHLGDLGHIPGEDLLWRLKGTDVLFIPVGGVYTIDAEEAFETCKLIEPNIIIPMHYKTPALEVNLGSLNSFLETVKGYYDRSFQRESVFSFSAEGRKKRSRVVVLEKSV